MEKDPMKSISAKALIEDGCSYHGFVVKEGGRFKSMQPRYFVLHQGCLYYFKDFHSTKEQGAICLAGYELREDLQHDELYGIRLEPIQPGKKTLYFELSTDDERKEKLLGSFLIWIEKFNHEMQRIAGDGGENYDYCYESRTTDSRVRGDEPPHNYELTDGISAMQSKPSANSYTGQPGPPVVGPKPVVPPPSIPPKVIHPKPRSSSGCNNNEFMPPLHPPKPHVKAPVPPPEGSCSLSTRQAPQPPNKAFSPPARERGSSKEMPPLPNPHTKPILPKNQSRFSQEELVRRNAGVAELARKMQQTRQMQKYEIQDIKNKASVSSDSDSEGSESYLDLCEQETNIKRGRPAGSSLNKHNRQPNANFEQEATLPKSAFQSTLSRDTAECLLNGIGQEGMYLFRQGRTGLQVLTVYTPDGCKHYQIFEDSGSLHLKSDEPNFGTLKELVNHYFKNTLPTCEYKLRTPYS